MRSAEHPGDFCESEKGSILQRTPDLQHEEV